MIVLAGSSNPQLAQKITSQLGASLAEVELTKFPNGEKRVWVKTPMQDQAVVVVQSFSEPVDENIVEFCLLVDACKQLAASKIVGLVPWFGYSPQDKSFRPGEPISAQVIARIIAAVGVDHLVTVDIHSKALLNHFPIPATEVSSLPLFVNYFKQHDLTDHVVISVDKGAQEKCQTMAQELKLPVCVFDKNRDRVTGEVTLELISGEVKGKTGIAFDDFVSTGATRIAASKILKGQGLVRYIDCITHPLLAGDSATLIQDSQIDQILTTDTYPIPATKLIPKLEVISVSPLLSDVIGNLTK